MRREREREEKALSWYPTKHRPVREYIYTLKKERRETNKLVALLEQSSKVIFERYL
jgi:hypothetical protein